MYLNVIAYTRGASGKTHPRGDLGVTHCNEMRSVGKRLNLGFLGCISDARRPPEHPCSTNRIVRLGAIAAHGCSRAHSGRCMKLCCSLKLNHVACRSYTAMSIVQQDTDSTFIIVGGGIAGLASVRPQTNFRHSPQHKLMDSRLLPSELQRGKS